MHTIDDTGEVIPAHDRLGYLINQARNAVFCALDEELSPLNLSAAQFIVVLGVGYEQARTPSALCRLLACDSGAMTRLLDRIEAKGIIRRVRSVDDRRAIHIKLTAKGHELQPQILQAIALVHERLVDRFSPEELSQFQRFLQRVAENAFQAAK